MYYVYFICSLWLKKVYIGQTRNLIIRLVEHNSGKVKTTKRGIPWILLGSEEYTTRWLVMKREKYLKSLYGYKIRRKIIKELIKKADLNNIKYK